MEVIDVFGNGDSSPPRSAAFDTLLAESWGCIWPDEVQRRLAQWRYYDDPQGRCTRVAIAGGRGVAMIDSVTRPYALHGQTVMVRETGDWYCQDKYRKFGLGLHLMRALMRDRPEPLLAIGGSEANRAILGKLWRKLPSAGSYVLPVKARGLLGNIIRLSAPAWESYARILGPLPFRRLRPTAPPQGCTAEKLDAWHELPHDSSQDLVGLLTPLHWRRLLAMPPDFGQAIGTIFRCNGAIVGCSLAQTEPTPAGKDGKILRLQTIAEPDAALLRWMVAVTSLRLAEEGAEFIRCRASTPGKIVALRAIGYRFSQEIPCFWFDPADRRTPAAIDVDYLRGDDAQPMQALIGLHLHGPGRRHGLGGWLGAQWQDLTSAS